MSLWGKTKDEGVGVEAVVYISAKGGWGVDGKGVSRKSLVRFESVFKGTEHLPQTKMFSLKGVFARKAYGEKYSLLIASNLTSICCVYRRKLLKRLTPKNVDSIQIQKVATFNSDRKKIN